MLLRCDHWLEATDPKHRYGSYLRAYYKFWLSKPSLALDPTHPASMDAFFEWLDQGQGRGLDLVDQGVPRAKLEDCRVRYLSLQERGRYEVEVLPPC